MLSEFNFFFFSARRKMIPTDDGILVDTRTQSVRRTRCHYTARLNMRIHDTKKKTTLEKRDYAKELDTPWHYNIKQVCNWISALINLPWFLAGRSEFYSNRADVLRRMEVTPICKTAGWWPTRGHILFQSRVWKLYILLNFIFRKIEFYVTELFNFFI